MTSKQRAPRHGSSNKKQTIPEIVERKNAASERDALRKYGLGRVGGEFGHDLSESLRQHDETRGNNPPHFMNRMVRRYAKRNGLAVPSMTYSDGEARNGETT